MTVRAGPSQIESLSPVGCDRHLRTEEIGRVALMVDDNHPEIFPVNYVVDEAGDMTGRRHHRPAPVRNGDAQRH